jgi:PAS domain-containing protein
MALRDNWGHRLGVPVAVLAATLVVTAGSGGLDPATAGVVLLLGSDRMKSFGGLVGSIAAGAIGLGLILWLVATGTTLLPVSALIAAGVGLAVGGGLGSVVWLFAVGDEEVDTGGSVTVDMDGQGAAGPAPEPVDLFEASPDPILFYAETPEGPVVRAVNPAFVSAFGVTSDALDGVPLREGLLVTEGAEDVVAAARAGETFDEVLACEGENGTQSLRVRLAATGRDRTDGYVLYTPTETAG